MWGRDPSRDNIKEDIQMASKHTKMLNTHNQEDTDLNTTEISPQACWNG